MNTYIASLMERLRRGGQMRKKEGTIPVYRHWKIILLCCAILLIGVFVFAFLLFASANKKETIAQDAIPARAGMLKKVDVEKVFSDYSEKKKRFEDLLAHPPPFLDPSQ